MVSYPYTLIPNESDRPSASKGLWKLSISYWVLILVASIAVALIFSEGVARMIDRWSNQEEYSHGFILPFISLFLVWQKSSLLRNEEFTGSWIGFATVVISILVFVLGELSSLYILIQYGFLIAIAGFVLSITGCRAFKHFGVALFFLLFMIPLPQFLYNNLSLKLQLLSSALGVQFIRFCDISVYLEGNVIDLGHYKLQVVDACSGLRYLFPFMSLSFLCAYLFNGAIWKRALIFFSSLPISVLMNSFRIGVIGVLVEYFGQGAAEGFLHYFEGWVIFLLCMAILLVEMQILARIGPEPKRFSDVFFLAPPPRAPRDLPRRERRIPRPAIASLVLLILAMALPRALQQSTEIVPNRKQFTDFPMTIGSWNGRPEPMKQDYLDALNLDDYVLANYQDRDGHHINYYVAYYGSQTKGHSIHSPRSCLPGAGWVVSELPEIEIARDDHRKVRVARVLIQQGEVRQLVYFWTQQRGRVLNNEFLIKWYLFLDALTKRRSDGALVRLTTQLDPTEDLARADQRLTAFAELSNPLLVDFVPN